MKKENATVSLSTIILYALSLLGIILIFYRFINGLGSVTNLNDDFPWGLWVGIDILAGIALASGGFVITGAIYLFGARKFHKLARHAVLTALLGYILFMCGLVLDLGRPWNLLHIIFTGNHTSPLYEVGWCVMFYTVVLFLEFLSSLFENYDLKRAYNIWKSITPWVIITMLTIFMFAMTHSWNWAFIMAVISLIWEISMRTDIMPRDKQMPVILIMAGVIFSTLHQSSLGSIFLIAPHDLHPLWYSPFLPVLFFLSAVMAGPAVIIIESYYEKKDEADSELLYKLSKSIPYLLFLYLIVNISVLVYQGAIFEIFKANHQALSWLGETLIGIVIPIFLFVGSGFTKKKKGIIIACSLVATGVVWNRINVSIVGIKAHHNIGTYFPGWTEVFITLGLFSIGIIIFKWASRNLMPVIYGK